MLLAIVYKKVRTMHDSQGSYLFDKFEDDIQKQEFDRLSRQAKILLPLEKQLWHHLELKTGSQVLDLGCGPGVITQALAKYVYPGDVVGVDTSEKLIRVLQTLKSLEGHDCQNNVTFYLGNVYDLDLPAETFDVVYARLLFQHLSEPMNALASILRVLKHGGKLCLLDVDDDWASLYPEPDSFSQLRQTIVKLQHARGGDPWVGRKLAHYLKAAGLVHVQTMIQLIDSNALGLASFFELLSFGAPYQSGHPELGDEIATASREIQALINHPFAWAGMGLFVATGHKP